MGEEVDGTGMGSCCIGRGRVRLGLGLGRFRSMLRRCPVGLGLRLLSLEMGLVKPLWLDSREMGATMETESRPSSSEVEEAKISAALSRTEGTDWSSCSEFLPLGMRCGSWLKLGGEGLMGSISLSNMAEEEECLREG